MFFTNIAGIFAVLISGVGLIIAGAAVYKGQSGLEMLMGASYGVGFIFAGCLIGVLVEISNSLNEIKKAGRSK